MEKSIVDRKALAAALLGCKPEELLGFRDEGLSGVVLIAPDGRKLRYPEELLRRAQAWFVAEPAESAVGVKALAGERLKRQGSPAEASTPEPAESAAGVKALAGERLKSARESIKKTPRPKGPRP